MKEINEEIDFNEEIMKMAQRGFRNILIFNLFFVIVWAVIVGLVPSGWWIALINVLCFIATLLVLWWRSYSYLKPFLGGVVGFFVSLLIWVALVVGVRSVVLDIIEGLSGVPYY